MRFKLIQIITSFFFVSICLANNISNEQSDRSRFLQQIESKQNQGLTDCPSDQCIQFDTNQSRCLKCAQSQGSHQAQNDCKHLLGAKLNEKTISLIIAILNLLFLAILQYCWIHFSQKNQNNFINSNQVINKKVFNPQSIVNTEICPIQLLTGIPIQTVPDNFSQSNNNKNIQDINQDEQKVECQQIKPQQTRFSLQVESINLSPDLLLQQRIQHNQQQQQQQQQQTQQQQICNNQLILQGVYQNALQNLQGYQNNLLILNNGQDKISKLKYSGYQLIQAGNYSFQNFSNKLRIRHVIINILILQLIYSKFLVLIKQYNKDNLSTIIDDYLVIEFLIGMILYWLFTFLLPSLVKIITALFCAKNITSCRCGHFLIALLFEIIAITLSIFITLDLLKMSTAMSQIWILLWSQGLLLIILFDIKSVKSLKSKSNSFMAKCVMFRKMNFYAEKV
ncbi:transmembrane protein, putative (macronuclear) [Tetrahymena thermophila SB210]|uniref:Transmembrane protein, putative n=1 Tax=Tetrahymena thermophila (strain SB210) TaxID=312017 RepID=W7XAG5_TETTS|nr:transmembrane protein, putative [Tetrahymena thermophila SB210]EWS73393.1 transmembrane protein, putative [Tetrahymena thermophila SB210]|eukprot:XP_012654083.1 transmembrane protein, putative [Tetrahymena thermophila SB210]